jgi:two-component system phosphate regulon sensor histidine kinase PhoR
MRERLSSHVDTIDRQRRTLDALVSQLREGVVVADAQARIVLINKEAVRMLQPEFGRSSEALIGLSIEQCVPQLQLQRMLSRHVRTGSGPDASPVGSNDALDEAKLQVESSTGVRTIFARATNIRLPDDVARHRSDEEPRMGRVLLLTDVTELTRVMQVKADLAANASHELRTPLSAIRAAVETLRALDAERDARAAVQLIDVVDRHSSRMEAMIGDLLELSRLESGAARFERRLVEIRPLLQEFENMAARKVEAKGLHFKIDIDPPDARIRVNPELLRMILRNLIDNAVRFTDAGGRVTVSCRVDDQRVMFRVADTGCGIAPEEQERVFERFYQVERARSGADRGTGLGLSIVRHAAAAMQAKLELKSELGEGTTITVLLRQAA